MGCTVREKHIRTNRRIRSAKSDIDPCCFLDRTAISKSILESGLKPLKYHLGLTESTQNPNPSSNPNSNPNLNLDDSGEAVSKLVSLGYDEDVAVKSILRNGHCYGGMDVLTNILQNSLAYLNSNCGSSNGVSDESEPVFSDLRQLQEYALAGIVCLLQQVRPHLSKGDAMWCLLMSDLHVGRASTMEISAFPCSGNGRNTASINGFFSCDAELVSGQTRNNCIPKVRPAQPLCQVGMPQLHLGPEVTVEQSGETGNLKNQDIVNSVLLTKFQGLNLVENLEFADQKDEVIVTLLHQIKELERQVKDRKDWAHQKAMQAARKLGNDLTELKMLRMEREETQRLKKGKQVLEDTTMKRLSEMENALRKASGQVDRANAAVRRLETENAEIRAEMEASKLSASESVTTCLEVAKREKKCLKRLLAWEKQKAKLQEETSDEKEKIAELQQVLIKIKQAQKEAEVKWREELKAKEEALAQVDEEKLSKEATEASNKRKLEALRLKIEIDFQRHKDDLQRLEQELSRIKSSTQSNHPLNTSPTRNAEGTNPQGETIAKLLNDLDKLEEFSEKESHCDRECIVCVKDEVSVVFLPCGHQVMCASCSDDYVRKGKATCPCCQVPVEQRIRVFGASS
ncbi:MND1-interacting 1-like protein [Quillaja saponaria]|uniref:MND1-interacting 1-like protein n=1 Tax=Quillaja saponaria TaxID=32244 RepID=A0AAD7KSX6_QUISA|nr:MND1-interacting 1-like protein [Quillaja saponaria]